MNPTSNTPEGQDDIERSAANWTLRIDRGLTPDEQDAYSQWLAEDERHGEAIALYRWGWDEFDRLAGLQTSSQARVDPDLLAPGNRFAKQRRWLGVARWVLPLAAALALASTILLNDGQEEETSFATKPAVELIARIETRTLSDGSVVELNRGTVLEVGYSETERRLCLVSGEAHFTVTKDPSRPFIVEAEGVKVRAIGTRFNVRVEPEAVDVIVTEGIVGVSSRELKNQAGERDLVPELGEGDRATIALVSGEGVTLSKLSSEEMERELGWKPRLLDFDDESLALIVEEFNKRNTVKIVLGDSSLAELRLSSAFWSDNVEGFVRLMESSFGMSAEWRGSASIELRKVDETEAR